MGGTLGRTDASTRQINSYLDQAQENEESIVKLCLLGPESLQMVHSGGTLSIAQKRQVLD